MRRQIKKFDVLQRALPFVAVGVAAIVAAGWLALGSPAGRLSAAAVFSDDFSDGVIDASAWTMASGGGPTVSETGGRLEIMFPGASSGGTFFGNMTSVCELSGDFDVQVDYQLNTWPALSGVRLALYVGSADIQRLSKRFALSTDEAYFTGLSGSQVGTTDTQGALRLTRTGTTTTAYYSAASVWVSLGTNPSATTADAPFILQAWSHDGFFGGQDVLVSFDNFTVNSGTLACLSTPTATPTNTPVPPTATNTPVSPTATSTSVPATATSTPGPATATSTPVSPTATKSATPSGSHGGTGSRATATPTPSAAAAARTPTEPAPTRRSGGQAGVIAAPDTGDGSGTAGGGSDSLMLVALAATGIALAGAGAAVARRGAGNARR